jgi:hypothetical protein
MDFMRRFAIRDVIWLIVVVTLGTVFLEYRLERFRDQSETSALSREKQRLVRIHQTNFARDSFRGQLLTDAQGEIVRQRYKKWKATGILDSDDPAIHFDP